VKKLQFEVDEQTYQDVEAAAKSLKVSVEDFVKSMFIQGLLALNTAVEVMRKKQQGG